MRTINQTWLENEGKRKKRKKRSDPTQARTKKARGAARKSKINPKRVVPIFFCKSMFFLPAPVQARIVAYIGVGGSGPGGAGGTATVVVFVTWLWIGRNDHGVHLLSGLLLAVAPEFDDREHWNAMGSYWNWDVEVSNNVFEWGRMCCKELWMHWLCITSGGTHVGVIPGWSCQ